MNEFDKLLEKLNSLKITQEKSDWEECIPDDIWNEYFNNFKHLKSGLDPDTHRWYETSVEAIEILGRILGIRYLTNSFSESQEIIDCYVTIEFFEMEAVSEVTYKRKK